MYWKSWLRLIGVALLLWILSTVDWALAIHAILELNPIYLICYLLCFVVLMLLRSLRLRLALLKLGYPLTFMECCVSILEPALMGLVTPGRLGEFSRAGYIHAHGVAMQEAVSVVTIERIIDTGVLLIFGAGGTVYIYAPGSYHFGEALLVVLGLSLFYGAIRGYGFLLRVLQKYLGWTLRWEPKLVTRNRLELSSAFHGVIDRAGTLIFMLCLVCVALNFAQVYLLARAFDFKVDYWVVIFAYAAATLVSLLPISVGGLGTREATYIMLMARSGITREQALLFSLLDGFIFGVLMLLVLLIPVWLHRILSSLIRLDVDSK